MNASLVAGALDPIAVRNDTDYRGLVDVCCGHSRK